MHGAAAFERAVDRIVGFSIRNLVKILSLISKTELLLGDKGFDQRRRLEKLRSS